MMSSTWCKVQVCGHLGADPEIRTLESGAKVANFRVATTQRWKDKETQQPQERTEWHRVAVFDERLVDLTERFLVKGSKVLIEGTLQTRKWTDKDSQERYTTEIVLPKVRGELRLMDPAPTQGSSKGAPMPQHDFEEEEIPF
jgi:single-strand DNA-binding protein